MDYHMFSSKSDFQAIKISSASWKLLELLQAYITFSGIKSWMYPIVESPLALRTASICETVIPIS